MVSNKKIVKFKQYHRKIKFILKYYSMRQLSDILEVSERSIYRWLNEKNIPHSRVFKKINDLYPVIKKLKTINKGGETL